MFAEQLSLPQRPLIIGIAGCSGSGKTTLARELTAQLSATLLPLDFYYICLRHLPPDERALQNFDHPDSLEHSLLASTSKNSQQDVQLNAPSTTSPRTLAYPIVPKPSRLPAS